MTMKSWWAGPDLNRRPSARQADVQPSLQDSSTGDPELLGKFEEFCLIDLQKSKRTTYEKIWYIRKLLAWLREPIEAVTKDTIREYLKTLEGKSESQYKNCLGSLKTFFRDFLQMGDAVEGFKFPKQQFLPKQIPTKTELQKFYSEIQSPKERALFLTYASSGLRRNEVLSLDLKDVDFDKRMIKPKTHTGDTKKAWISFFNEECEKALKQYMETRSDNNPKLFPLARKIERRLWYQSREKTGLTVTPQGLRMWFCEELGRLGVQDRYIDAFCGRIPKSVLARHYSDFSPDKLKAIYDNANLKIMS
jgi:integrase